MTLSKKPVILIADDEDDVLVLLERCFVLQDWEIIIARDGIDCISKAEYHRPDLIVLDIIMPCLDGYHACHFLKKHPALKQIPIVMLTAKTEPFQQEKGEMVGADAYFCKPCDMNILIERIKTLLYHKPF